MEKVFKQFSDIRIKKLIKKHGYIGFGVYNAILQDMYNNDNSMSMDLDFLASEYEVSEQVINSILNDFSLFENTDGIYASCLISEILEKKKVKSDKARESIRVRWNKNEEKSYERNTNVYERIRTYTNVYDRNTNVSKNQENDQKNVKSIKMCENTIVDEPNEINTEYSLIQENCTPKKQFNFKKELASIGVEENLVSDFMKVRNKKKLVNTQIAFNKLKKEIDLSGLSASDCITICIEKSWGGFEAAWLDNIKNQNTFNTKQKTAFNRESDFN
jgi:hypothetical protein